MLRMRGRGPVHGEVKFAIALYVLMLAQKSPSIEAAEAEPT